MAGIDIQFDARCHDPLTMHIVAHGSQKLYIQTQQGHIVGNVTAHTPKTAANLAGIGIPIHQRTEAAAADIHIDTANHHRISACAKHIALTGNEAFLQQIGNVYRYGRSCDLQCVRQFLLRDHRVRCDQIQNLIFSLCHPVFPFLFLKLCLYYNMLFILSTII